jgi:hypothetical protein
MQSQILSANNQKQFTGKTCKVNNNIHKMTGLICIPNSDHIGVKNRVAGGITILQLWPLQVT